ncbi:M20/M25/M40 family metallo-hydrolase [bacterium]|nr:M20/M25/M40 family metallo-hydrolase [bacterium]
MKAIIPAIIMLLLVVAAPAADRLPFVSLDGSDRVQQDGLRSICEEESWWIQIGDRLYSPSLGEAESDPAVYYILDGAPVPPSLADRVAASHLSKTILYLPDGPPTDLHGTNCPDCPFEGSLTPLAVNRALVTETLPGTPLPTGIPDFMVADAIQAISVDIYTSQLVSLTSIDSRCTHSDGNDAARDYIAAEFASMGLDVELQHYEPILRGIGYTNVIGRLEGARYPDQFLVVGGHYDSLPCPPNPGPGAEDNASGTAGVLEAARVISQVTPRPQRTILFVTFSAEEQGLLGSEYFVEQFTPQDYAGFRGALIMDMISYTSDPVWDVHVESFIWHANFASTVLACADDFSTLTRYWSSSTGRSDHMSFLNRGLAAVLIIESEWGNYPYYHTSDDTMDKITPAVGSEVLRMTIAAALQLANPDPVGPSGMMIRGSESR